MGRKKKKSLTPQPKRMDRNGRIQHAKATRWVENFTGKDLVRGYRRWFGVDALSAVLELRMFGVRDLEEREAQIREEISVIINFDNISLRACASQRG